MRTLFPSLMIVGLLTGPAAAADPVDYLRDIKPIFTKHCISCHGAQKQRGGLRLDTAKSALEGGNSGAIILAGKSSQSILIKAVNGGEGDIKAMPPKESPRLAAEQIALLKSWIDQGAKVPATETVDNTKTAQSDHWSLQPIRRLALPPVKNASWPRNPIDYFILARLEKEKLTPSPEADRATLLRRVSLDLTGLPPTPTEVETALNDK